MFYKNEEKKRTLLDRLRGVTSDNDESSMDYDTMNPDFIVETEEIEETSSGEGELSVDLYQTDTEIIIQTMPAGVRSDELNISISPEMITISGKRDAPQGVLPGDYMIQELYWGSFSRTIVLPEEIDPTTAEAIEKHGLLNIRLQKIDKNKQHRLKVKSV